VVTPFAELSDDELLAATREHPEAFGVFYERHVRGVLAFASRRLRDPEAALDLTAEVFAAALVAAGRYRPGEAPARAWLVGIARKKLAALGRRNARADAARRRLGIPRLSFGDAALERVEEMIDAELALGETAIDDLSEAEHEAVLARVVDERAYGDLAVDAGTSEAAIRQRVSRGLAKLARRRTR
jgi:RNA polymerase sigma-70 factor, ECF subfamily